MKSVVNLDANAANPRKANKRFGDTASNLPGLVGKEVDDVVKGDREVGRGVGDADKGAGATTTDFVEEVGKGVSNQGAGPGEVRKGVSDTALANVLVDVLANPFSILDSPLICAAVDFINKPYTRLAIPPLVDIST